MINPVHMRTLRAVLSTGSFADAGRLLGYTASGVAQHIKALEDTTGTVLFERGPHSVHPTAVALVLAERGQAVLTALADLGTHANLLATGREGLLRLGAFASASHRIIPPALAALKAFRPRAEVQLIEAEPRPVLAQILDGELDLGLVFAYDMVPRLWPTEVAVSELFREELILMVPSAHALVRQQQISMYDLAEDIWIATGKSTDGATALDRICANHGFVPNVAFRSDSYDMIRALVRAGLGIAIVPLLGHQEDPGVKSTSLSHEFGSRRVLVVHWQNNSNPLLPDALRALSVAAADERLRCAVPPAWCRTRYDADLVQRDAVP